MAVKEFNMNKIKRTFWPFTLKDKKDEIAFGPYLAIGATVACLYGSTLENIYLSMF